MGQVTSDVVRGMSVTQLIGFEHIANLAHCVALRWTLRDGWARRCCEICLFNGWSRYIPYPHADATLILHVMLFDTQRWNVFQVFTPHTNIDGSFF